MKYIKVLLSLVFVLALAACGGGNKTSTGSSGTGGSVALFTSAPATVSLASGSAATGYTIGGGTGSYAVATSSPAIAGIGLSGNTFTISAGAAGTAQIVVTDSAGAKVTIDVTVTAPTPPVLFTTAPSAIEVPSGVGIAAVYRISGGTQPYSVASSNVGVALAAITSGSTLNIFGNAVGAATVDVVDAAGSKVSIAVTVSSSVSVPSALNVLPAGASGMVGDVLTFTVGGGTAAYTVTATNGNTATLSAVSATTTGGTFTATLKNVGTTDVTLTDSRGQTVSFTLSVTAPVSQMRLLPGNFIIGENELRSFSLKIYGGVPPYTTYTSNNMVSNPNIFDTEPSTVQIFNGLTSNRCINPVDDTGAYVPGGTYDVIITVKDTLGATATSTMTIKDNGAGLNVGCP